MNHHYTREERLRLADVDGIDYLPPNSAVFRRWLAKQPHRRVPAAPLVWHSSSAVVGIPASGGQRQTSVTAAAMRMHAERACAGPLQQMLHNLMQVLLRPVALMDSIDMCSHTASMLILGFFVSETSNQGAQALVGPLVHDGQHRGDRGAHRLGALLRH